MREQYEFVKTYDKSGKQIPHGWKCGIDVGAWHLAATCVSQWQPVQPFTAAAEPKIYKLRSCTNPTPMPCLLVCPCPTFFTPSNAQAHTYREAIHKK